MNTMENTKRMYHSMTGVKAKRPIRRRTAYVLSREIPLIDTRWVKLAVFGAEQKKP